MKTRKTFLHLFILSLFLFYSLLMTEQSVAGRGDVTSGKKVLVVASYNPQYQWCKAIVETLQRDLFGAELTVFYMDTKRNPDGAEKKAKEAFALYRKMRPDAVIAIDDNAVAFFVVPYLKDKVSTPVIFCGVNDDAGRYGLPATNVTGVLEKKHYMESISFAQLINPKIRAIAVLYRPGTSNTINIAQIRKEKEAYFADIIAFMPVNSVADLRAALADYSADVDAFLLLDMTGIVDENNRQLEGDEAIALVVSATELVTIGTSDWEIEAGALCGVIKSGEEQGALAAAQLLALWEGSSMGELPVTMNKNGRRFLNVKTMKRLHIKLRPEMVIGTEIISGN